MDFYHPHMAAVPLGLLESDDNESNADSVAPTDVVLFSDDDDPDCGIHYDVACPELSGTPPQPPSIRVRLPGIVPFAKRRRVVPFYATSTTSNMQMDTTEEMRRIIPMDVWKFLVVPYADLPSLLQLYFTCRDLHNHLNEPTTIQTYLSESWFVQRPLCDCDRNQHRLDVSKICEFYWDRIGVHCARDMEVALRVVGRGVDMYGDPRRSRPIRPRVEPDAPLMTKVMRRHKPQQYTKGILSSYFDGLVVPLPRLLSVPVESQRLGSVGYRAWKRAQEPGESIHDYQTRLYWRGCHDVDRPDGDRTSGFDEGPYVDLVKDYVQRCAQEDRDPTDPSKDDEAQTGYHADHWARHQNNRGPVGVQSYPVEICLSRREIRGSTARRGLSEIDMLFLPAERAPTQGDDVTAQVMMHNGMVYLHPIRYINETGDFVPWCLSTIAVMRGIRQYMWYDSILYIIRRLNEFTLLVATEVQNDLSFPQMMLRWEFLQRTEVRMEARWPPDSYVTTVVPAKASDPTVMRTDCIPPTQHPPNAEYTEQIVALQKCRNERAGRLLRCPLYANFNRHIENKIAEYERSNRREVSTSFRDGYLVSMIPTMYDHPPTPHTEVGMMRQLHRQIWLADYIVEFAGSVGPRVDSMTDFRRNRTLSAYLGVATSLLAFAPGFTDRPHWWPYNNRMDAGSVIPRVNLTHNHRFQLYRDFVSARQHFFDPPAPLYNPL